MPNTSDIRIRSVRPLISPAILEAELPLDDAGSVAVQRARREVAQVIVGQDDRLLAVLRGHFETRRTVVGWKD